MRWRPLAEPHVVTALVRKRAELAGDIESAHEALRKMILELENLDATLVMFDPSYRVESIKPKAFRPPKELVQQRPDDPDMPVDPQAGLRTAHKPGYRRPAPDRASPRPGRSAAIAADDQKGRRCFERPARERRGARRAGTGAECNLDAEPLALLGGRQTVECNGQNGRFNQRLNYGS